MTNQIDSASQKVPQEIWWNILDNVIDVPVLFSTIYKGDDWAKDAHRFMRLKQDDLYKASERQRKVIGSVCSSWQIFSRSRRNRTLRLIGVPKDLATFTNTKVSPTKRITITGDFDNSIVPNLSQEMGWNILSISQALATNLAPVPHPHIRRLQLDIDKDQKFDPNLFLDTLSRFNRLTWLDFCLHPPTTARSNTPVTRETLVLPSLQVLFYESSKVFEFPLSHLVLPSLRNLAVHCDLPANRIPVLDILLPYSKTLQFVTFSTGRSPKDTVKLQFPQWSDFPKLQDLVFSEQWAVHFVPLPPDHPLKRVIAQHTAFEALHSFLDGVNMQEFSLLRAGWNDKGELVREIDWEHMIDNGALFVEKAKERDILFQTRWFGEEFMTREEALAVWAAEAVEGTEGR
jgi:hypothetical protein